MTISTHVLDTERGQPAAGVRVELWRGDELVGSRRDRRRRPHPRARRRRPGHLPARLPSAVAVLPPRRARGRARRGPPPRPAARLAPTRARPTAAAERRASWPSCSRAARASSSGSRARGSARPRARGRASLSDEEKKEVLDAHPAIGATKLSARSAAEQGPTTTPRARRARRAEPRLRGALRLPLRRLRQPPAEVARSCRSCASGSSARASRSSTTALDELVAIAEDRWRRS